MTPISFDNDNITDITIDGEDVKEVTMDGDVVWVPYSKIIDSFEDRNINEYSLDTGSYETTSAVSKHETYALEGNFANDTKQIVSTNYNLDDSNTYRGNMYIDGFVKSGIIFGVEDDNSLDGYQIRINNIDDNFEINKFNDGSLDPLASTGQNINQNEWYEIEFDWGSMEATLFDSSGNQKANISANDSTYNSGGLGFRMISNQLSGDITYFDFVREMK